MHAIMTAMMMHVCHYGSGDDCAIMAVVMMTVCHYGSGDDDCVPLWQW